jgi:uncharacterized BrkB/YihY/UPF0761 family membrane protein
MVQNNVKPQEIGSATASLTFFQQIGGTIGLTIAGTLLADSLTKEIPARMIANGVPQQLIDGFQANGGSGGALNLTGTGDLGKTILDSLPAAARAFVEPFIGQIVTSIHEAFAVAISGTFWVSIGAAALAAILVLFLREVPTVAQAQQAHEEAA